MCLGGINTYTKTHLFFFLSVFICCSSKMIRTKHIFLHFVFILLRSNFSIYSIFYRRPNKIFVFALNSFIFHCSHSLCGCWGEWNMAECRIRGRTKNMDVALEIRLHPNWAAIKRAILLAHSIHFVSQHQMCSQSDCGETPNDIPDTAPCVVWNISPCHVCYLYAKTTSVNVVGGSMFRLYVVSIIFSHSANTHTART